MKEMIQLRTGELVVAYLVRQYEAFEGSMRYIFRTDRGEYRCVKDDEGNYIELVV